MIVGPNGAGKTNLLEAVHVATQGFSPRTRRDARTVRLGAARARVAAGGSSGRVPAFRSEVVIAASGQKRISLNGAAVSGPEALRRHFAVLAFTPDRLAVVKGAPIVRRTYLDRALGRVFPARAEVPGEYARALAQRNAALRRVRDGISSPEALAPWSEAVARLGATLDAARAETIAALGEPFASAAEALGLEGAALTYVASEVTLETLEARLARDLERGTTGAGPHLADVAITAQGRDLRAFGSQGEQRLAVLALLLAEAAVVAERVGDPPLLLLDDVLSELDDGRRSGLISNLPRGCQTLVTATSLRSLPPGIEPAAVVDVAPGSARLR